MEKGMKKVDTWNWAVRPSNNVEVGLFENYLIKYWIAICEKTHETGFPLLTRETYSAVYIGV